MKPRLRIVLPPRGSLVPARGSRARLPFMLVPVLAGMAVVQLVLPQRIDLPPGGSVARVGFAVLPDVPPMVLAPPQLASRDPFAPPARAGGTDSSDPLEGAIIAGTVQKGRSRLGVIQQPGGAVRYVAVGGTVSGWRLVGLDQAGARLTRGPGQNLVVTYGLHPTVSKGAGSLQTMAPVPAIGALPMPRNPRIDRFFSPQSTESGQ